MILVGGNDIFLQLANYFLLKMVIFLFIFFFSLVAWFFLFFFL